MAPVAWLRGAVALLCFWRCLPGLAVAVGHVRSSCRAGPSPALPRMWLPCAVRVGCLARRGL
eukprot:14881254-Alexandrium_andersonii.AAC.1